MEIKQENKFKRLFKRFGGVAIACVAVIAIALALAFSVGNNLEEVSGTPIEFDLPMSNARVVKDYSDSRLQHVEGTKKYAIHLSMDFAPVGEDKNVLSICDGIVTTVDTNSEDGTVVTIEHSDGFVSMYASLDKDIHVKEGDHVRKGQKIGEASQSAGYEKGLMCDHMHFTLFKDGVEVDPNNYLNLQIK